MNESSRIKLHKLQKITVFYEYGDNLVRLLPELHHIGVEKTGGKRLVQSRTVTFQVTDDCNLKCSYCYQINKGHRKMSFETGKKIVDMLLTEPEKIKDYINLEISPGIILDFIGGEPFLAIDIIRDIYEYFLKKAMNLRHPWGVYHCMSFSTNGTLYFDPKVQDFLNKYKNNVSVAITLDGNKELHDACRVFPDGSGSYDLALAAIKDRVSKGFNMTSKLTVAPENLPYLYKAVVHLYELGYNDVHFNCVYEKGWTIEHAKMYYNELKKIANYIINNSLYFTKFNRIFTFNHYHPDDPTNLQTWCGGTGDMLAFDPDGNAYPCLRYMESSLGKNVKPIIIGNADNGLEFTEEQQELVKELRAVNRRTQSTDECFYCPISSGCSYCSAYNYQCFGTPNSRATFICDMHKAESLANAYFWNKVFLKEEIEGVYFEIYLPEKDCLRIISKDEYNNLIRDRNKIINSYDNPIVANSNMFTERGL